MFVGKQEANDARLLRAAIVNVLEEACLPGVTDEEKRKLLSFVVRAWCGSLDAAFSGFGVVFLLRINGELTGCVRFNPKKRPRFFRIEVFYVEGKC